VFNESSAEPNFDSFVEPFQMNDMKGGDCCVKDVFAGEKNNLSCVNIILHPTVSDFNGECDQFVNTAEVN
jgi:hypothetical protein